MHLRQSPLLSGTMRTARKGRRKRGALMSTDPNESHDPYVETREGQLYVRGSEVRLERLILLRSRAQTPEALRDQFPLLSLAAILRRHRLRAQPQG